MGGEVEVTLTAMPRDSDGPSGQVRIRFDFEGTRDLVDRLTAAIATASFQLKSQRPRQSPQTSIKPLSGFCCLIFPRKPVRPRKMSLARERVHKNFGALGVSGLVGNT